MQWRDTSVKNADVVMDHPSWTVIFDICSKANLAEGNDAPND